MLPWTNPAQALIAKGNSKARRGNPSGFVPSPVRLVADNVVQDSCKTCAIMSACCSREIGPDYKSRGVGVLLKLILVFSFAFPLWAVGLVQVRDVSGSTQNGRPTSVFMTFKQGDIPHYAQAKIGSTPVTTQCDVKTRWAADNSVKQAMVTFAATVPTSGLTVDFQDQASGNNTGALDRKRGVGCYGINP